MCKCVVPACMGYGCECKCRKSARTTGVVFNPWPYQERTFKGHVFAEADSVKPDAKSLIVTNRCRVA